MKTRKPVCLLLAVVLLLCPVFATAGGADDPLVSLSWLYDTWLPDLQLRFTDLRMSKLDAAAEKLGSRLDNVCFPESEKGEYLLANTGKALSLHDGGNVSMAAFSSITVQQGEIYLSSLSGELLDLTKGTSCSAGERLLLNHRYFAAENTVCILKSYSDHTKGMVDGYFSYCETGDFSLTEQFLDIGNHWGKSYIFEMTGRGIMNGISTHAFAPDAQVTRSMFVTVLARLCGADISESESRFTDVNPGDWFLPYVNWAAQNGIVNGYTDGSFAPNEAISREQMALILCRFCDAYGYELEIVAEGSAFKDADKISPWAADAVERARAWGLISGKGNDLFDPAGTATRAEMCAVICRLAAAAEI